MIHQRGTTQKSTFRATLDAMAEARKVHSSVLVSYSGGKDSLTVLDLCTRTFDHVECLFMYLVPGLRAAEEKLAFARQRYGVKITEIPHWAGVNHRQAGIYSWGRSKAKARPWKLDDCYMLARHLTGIHLIAHGGRSADSLWRRRNFATASYYNTDMLFPLKSWNKFDVLGYLKAHDLPLPSGCKGNATGIGLTVPELTWLAADYPDDIPRIERSFPFVRAALLHEKLYGSEAKARGERGASGHAEADG